jgi:2-dehydropantoate 2-reductase
VAVAGTKVLAAKRFVKRGRAGLSAEAECLVREARKDAEEGGRVAVFGAGAVGCYFGGMLARSGVPVTLVGRPRHVDAIAAEGLLMRTTTFTERVRVAASAEHGAARGAGLVLVAVKSWDTEEAARALAPHLSEGATVLSLQNGIENAALLRAGTGRDAFPAVVWVAAEMTSPDALTHSGRGDLVIGDETPKAPGAPARRRALEAAAAVFAGAGVPCAVSEDVAAEMWAKLAANCAFNAVSALGRARYARLTATPDRRRLFEDLVSEVLAVAAASGVDLRGRGPRARAPHGNRRLERLRRAPGRRARRACAREPDARDAREAPRGGRPMTVFMRAMLAFSVACLVTCLGFAVPALHWLCYLPGIFLRRLMVLLALAIPIGSWQALALEFGFNLLAFFALVFAVTALVPRRKTD